MAKGNHQISCHHTQEQQEDEKSETVLNLVNHFDIGFKYDKYHQDNPIAMSSKRNTLIMLVLLIAMTFGSLFIIMLKSTGTYGMGLLTAILVFIVPILVFVVLVVLWGYRANQNPGTPRHSQ